MFLAFPSFSFICKQKLEPRLHGSPTDQTWTQELHDCAICLYESIQNIMQPLNSICGLLHTYKRSYYVCSVLIIKTIDKYSPIVSDTEHS